MLILSRKKNQRIQIGDDITITVMDVRGDKVRLGLQAPKEVPIHRSELLEAAENVEEESYNRRDTEIRVGRDHLTADDDDYPDLNHPVNQPTSSGTSPGAKRDESTASQKADQQNDIVKQLNDERDRWRRQFHRALDELIDAKRESMALRDALNDSTGANARMLEYFEGVVRHREANEVVVAYTVEDEIIEQTYQSSQFIDGNIPNVNDHLSVLVRVADVQSTSEVENDGSKDAKWFDDGGEPLSREF